MGRHQETGRTKTANITEDETACAEHRQNISVLRSNITFCGVYCFSSATTLVSSQ